jgi:hypothetical protein
MMENLLTLVAIFRRSRTDDANEIGGLAFSVEVQNLIAAMLAPYSWGFLPAQSDFGHPAGTVLST